MAAASVVSVLFLCPAATHASTSIISQEIATDTVWNQAGSPYLINGNITFDASSSLVIEPGTEVDFGPSGYISVYGPIVVGSSTAMDGVGAQDQEIKFVGNYPDAGDGKGCQFHNEIDIYGNSSTAAHLSNFEMVSGLELYVHDRTTYVSHGKFDCGRVGLRMDAAQAEVTDSTFTNFDDTAMQVISGSADVVSSTFDGGWGVGLTALSSNITVEHSTDENFSVGMNVVASDATITDSIFKENGTGVAASDRVFLVSLVDLPPLNKNYSDVYMQQNIFDNNYRSATTTRSAGNFVEQDDWAGNDSSRANLRRPVVVIPGILGSAFKDDAWVIDPIFHVYDNLLDTMRAAGYADGVTLFPFGYDWHQSNETTAILLGDFLQKVRGICGCDTVDIVAHSMGGLVARQYIQSPEYKGDVGHMVFLGTPHLGSPNALFTYAYDSFGDTIEDKVLAFMFGREAKANGYSALSSYVQGMPITSVKELLPITSYINAAGGPIPYGPGHYVINDFLQKLRDTVSALLSRVDVFNIAGASEDPTVSGFAMDGFTEDPRSAGWTVVAGKQVTTDLGDGEVVWSSNRAQLGPESMVIDSGHADGLVLRTLTGVMPTTLVHNPFSPSYDAMIIQTLFPLHIFILDPDGQYVGFDDPDASSTDDDGDLAPAPTIPIDRAFYTEDASSTYVVIPHPKKGKYTVVVSSKEKDPKKAKTVKKATVDAAVSDGKHFTTSRSTIPEIKPLKKAKIKIIIKYVKDPTTVSSSSTNATSTGATTTAATTSDPFATSDPNDEVIDGGQAGQLPLDDSMAPTPDDFSGGTLVATDTPASTTVLISFPTPFKSGSRSGSHSGGRGEISTTSASVSLTQDQIHIPPRAKPSPPASAHSPLAKLSTKSVPKSAGYHASAAKNTFLNRLYTLEKQWYNRAMEILEKLFGGAAKVRIIKLFLFNPEALYPRNEVISRTKSSMKDVKANIALLEKVGFLKSRMVTLDTKKKAEAWYLDQTFPYIGALQSLLINIMPLGAGDITKRLQKAGKMKLILTSGVFIQNSDSRVDLLVVGDGIKRAALENAVRGLEADIGKELTYAYFDTDDYLYRLGMYDKLVRDILDFPHTVVVDKISA